MALSLHDQSEIISNLLLEILPYYVNEADELFIKLSNASKSYFYDKEVLSIFSNEKFQYYKLYLEPQKIYQDFDKFISDSYKQEFEDELKKQILKNDRKNNMSTAVSNYFNAFDDIVDCALLNPNWHRDYDFDKDSIYLINVIIARFFDSLSLIENKKSISHLLLEALLDNQYLNIPKAVAIDPNVQKIPEIHELILKQDLKTQASLSIKIGEAIEKSFLTSNKNTQCKLPLFYINTVDSMGLIDGHLSLTFKQHKDIAQKVGALKDVEDDNYFYKLFYKHKKNKKSITKSKTV